MRSADDDGTLVELGSMEVAGSALLGHGRPLSDFTRLVRPWSPSGADDFFVAGFHLVRALLVTLELPSTECAPLERIADPAHG